MMVEIETVSDYRLYIKRLVNERVIAKKQTLTEEVLMQIFMDGIKFTQQNLKVEV